jgi:hypothetical protein
MGTWVASSINGGNNRVEEERCTLFGRDDGADAVVKYNWWEQGQEKFLIRDILILAAFKLVII